jgi:large subunit ribosomal protein L21
MFAVIESGSKQYHVKSGDVIKIERIAGEVGSVINFDKVLMVNGKVGSPVLADAKVSAEVLEHVRSDKVLIFKKKRRHNYRRKRGHRQSITVLRIKEIKG